MRFAQFVTVYIVMIHGGFLPSSSSHVSAFSPIRTRNNQLVKISQVNSSSDKSLQRRKTTISSTSSVEEEMKQKPRIKFYNSLSRTKDPFQPVCDSDDAAGDDNVVKMYTCGPTVYDYAHVGNFRAFLTYDVVKRTLQYFGYDVLHICNLTDIDDKIIARCDRENVGLLELTRKFEGLFMKDLEALNIIKAQKYPRATEHIDEMVQMIQDLHANGLAYQSDEGSWYFAVDKKEGYGQQLVNLDTSNMKQNASGMAGKQRTAAASIDADEYDTEKEGVRDFALWKAFKPDFDRDDATWDTKIGKGRPGWHLECSAMAKKYLGNEKPIDIHCGGVDLKFPHHENEIAQSEGASPCNCQFCNFWIHNGFVNIGDEKMSKSKGNFLTLRTACPSPMEVRAYRYLVVSSQYRNPLSFTQEAMKASQKALKRMDILQQKLEEVLPNTDDASDDRESEIVTVVEKQLQNFEAALLDDLAMPRASASLFAIIKAAENEFKRVGKDSSATLDLVGLQAVHNAIQQMDQVFGIFYEVPSNEEDKNDGDDDDSDSIPQEVLELVQSRTSAKDAKDWSLADELRDRITELGFVVKDVKGGEPIVSRVN